MLIFSPGASLEDTLWLADEAECVTAELASEDETAWLAGGLAAEAELAGLGVGVAVELPWAVAGDSDGVCRFALAWPKLTLPFSACTLAWLKPLTFSRSARE